MRYVKQEGIRDCGIACLYNIIRYYKGDVENPRGGVRGVIPSKQNYVVETTKKSRKISNRFKRWTVEEENELWELINKGAKIDDLMSIFNRSWKSIFCKLKILQLKHPISNEDWQNAYAAYQKAPGVKTYRAMLEAEQAARPPRRF